MIDINKKIMEAMKARDKVASETYKLLKAKILEFKTAKNAKEYTDAEEIKLIQKMIQERQDSICIYLEAIAVNLQMQNGLKFMFLKIYFLYCQQKMM